MLKHLVCSALALSICCCSAGAAEDEASAGPPDGSLVHFELPSLDLQQSMDFYGSVFNWTFEPMGDMYVLFSTPGGEGGGFTKDFAPGEGGGLFYIYASDVQAKLEEAVAAGATVAMDVFPVPGYGWIAIFVDPHGNKVGLFSSDNPPAGDSEIPALPAPSGS